MKMNTKKIILITGSTDGIGKLAAMELASEGHILLLHGRNKEKLDAVVAEVKEYSRNEEVSGFVADFSDLSEVKHMAQQVRETVRYLDVLVNNAGVFKSSKRLSKQGYDLRFAVNYFASVVLTGGLWDLLVKNTGRVINVGSAAQTSIFWEVATGQARVTESQAYAQSKLAITMWSRYLAKSQGSVSVVAVNPGSLLDTRMVREAYGTSWAPAEKGARVLAQLALIQLPHERSGEYFDNDAGEFRQAHPDVYNQNEVENLVQRTERLLGEFIDSDFVS